MLRSIPGVAWVLVDVDGIVTYSVGASDGVAAYAGIGSRVLDAVHPDDQQRVVDAIGVVRVAPGTSFVERAPVGIADGSWRVFDLMLVNRLGDIVGAIVVRFVEVMDAAPLDG